MYKKVCGAIMLVLGAYFCGLAGVYIHTELVCPIIYFISGGIFNIYAIYLFSRQETVGGWTKTIVSSNSKLIELSGNHPAPQERYDE